MALLFLCLATWCSLIFFGAEISGIGNSGIWKIYSFPDKKFEMKTTLFSGLDITLAFYPGLDIFD